jgi:hypothetical protein
LIGPPDLNGTATPKHHGNTAAIERKLVVFAATTVNQLS